MAGLDDILAGINPYAGQQLAAAMSAQLGADPGRLAYSSGPVGQALGQISGGFERAHAVGLANALAQERMTALPDLAAAYASDNPYGWVKDNPDASPLARAMILSSSPLDVAKAKEAGASAAIANLNLRGFQGLQGGAGMPPGTPLSTGGLGAGATAPIGAPANRKVAVQPQPLREADGGAVNPYYPGGADKSGGAGGAGAADFDKMNAQQLQAYAKGQLNPTQRYQLARWYAQRQATAQPAPAGPAAAAGGAGGG